MPALQNFKQLISVVNAAWLNIIDGLVTTVFEQAQTKPAARTALFDDAPLEIGNGGTASRTASTALTALGGVPASQSAIVALLYPVALGETAGIVVNYQYPPYTVDRYGTNATPGSTDMYPAIQTANNAATVAGAAVNFIPGSVYGINVTAHNAALSMTTNWVCNGPRATLIRTDFTTATAYWMVTAMGVSNLTMRGLTFNGQVTTVAAGGTPNMDLGPVGSYNDNGTESLWTQCYGVLFRSTQYCLVEDCIFMNTLRAGLRLDSGGAGGPAEPSVTPPIPPYSTTPPTLSLGNTVINCNTIRTRGVYGDGFIAVDSENLQWTNCYVYDYQRTGWDHDFAFLGCNGVQMTNCVADYGHDAVTSAAQFNCGIYIESADGYSIVNCESKATAIGFETGGAANPAQGVWRPFTGTASFKGCNAVRCQSAGFKIQAGNRDMHISLTDCFAEVNSTAATYSYGTGIGANAYQVGFVPATGGPNNTSNIAVTVKMTNCRTDMVAMSGIPTAAGFNCFNGTVANGQQLNIVLDKFSVKWLTSAGVNDPTAMTTYESTTAPNFGYFGDIVFSGANNGGSRFGGFAKILNCLNETSGTVMVSSEFNSGNAVMEICNTRVSLRTGGATTNLGILNLSNCDQVDYRGNPGFSLVTATGCYFSDMDPAHAYRGVWGSNGSTFFQFSNCTFFRNFEVSSGQGPNSSHYPTTSIFNGCTWRMTYQTEPGLTILKPGGIFASLVMSGCTFIDTGSISTNNPFILVNSTDSDFVVMGAGNTFDKSLTLAGGHVITVNVTPFDSPQTVAGIYETVFGFAAIPLS
jgi:hypothetical protein